MQSKIKFNRNELAGAFGDIGTDLPLIAGMILINNLSPSSTLIMFGLMQIMSGCIYGIPIAVQPLKAMAAIMLAQKLDINLLYGAGLSVGIIMLFLSITGLLDKLARIITRPIVRGIQLGLGLTLVSLSMTKYLVSEGIPGYILAGISFFIVILLLDNKKYPPALIVILIGLIYAIIFHFHTKYFNPGFGIQLPNINQPTLHSILIGFILLGLPQIPLSIGNSILATKQIIIDYFPEKNISAKKIGITYSLMNLINPFLSGIPTCHGAGGITGHYAFGARTGGSLMIYGSFYLITGIFFSKGFNNLVQIFPLPTLGIILFFEGIFLIALLKDIMNSRRNILIALIVGSACFSLPYGYLILKKAFHYKAFVVINITRKLSQNDIIGEPRWKWRFAH